MKGNLLHKYRLEKKVAKLEKLTLERSLSNTGGPSKAYQIWDYLMNNGPKTVDQLKSDLPKDITKYINFFADNNLLIKNGNTVSANADYAWDDIGVIPRTARQELANSIRNSAPSAADIQEEPASRAPRAPKQRAVKQNIFSRKFEEVKAAVDAGQDVNQVNDKGQTPLLFAANSRAGDNSDIIEYLLTHGADLSSEFKGLTAFDLVCKNSNIDGMRVILANDTHNVISKPSHDIKLYYKDVPNNTDVILLAASKERRDFDGPLHNFYYQAYVRKIVSREQYEQIINTILDNCKYKQHSSDVIRQEVLKGITNTIRKIADKEDILVRLYHVVLYDSDRISDDTAHQLLSLCEEAVNGKIAIRDSAVDFISICTTLCDKVNDKSFMGNLLNPVFVSKLDYSDLRLLFYKAVASSNVNTLSKLIAAKVKLMASTVCISRYVQEANKEITRLATRLIDRNTQLNNVDIDDIARCSNEYLISYVIDMGYGEEILAWCAKNINSLNDDMAVVKALKENGFDIPGDEDSKRKIISRANSKYDIKYMTNRIIDAIIHDEWRGDLEKIVTDHPEILLDNSVTKAIEDNNTTTSRQLRRRIDRMPKDQDVYDL